MQHRTFPVWDEESREWEDRRVDVEGYFGETQPIPQKQERFWTCHVEGTNGGVHHQHTNYMEARAEAERLARLNVGKHVYVMRLASQCKALQTPVQWEAF
jgi:hypothetical protein